MTNIAPGAIWTPVAVGNRAARRKGRGLIGHVAVSNSLNLVPGGTPESRASDWHFYLPREAQPTGRYRQYIDLDLQSWSSAAANGDTAAFESQGGMGSSAQVNAEPWSDNQIESAATILAYMNETEGVPLQDMVNSLASSRGFGVHRYGIDPWRVTGGQVWSSSRGKLCPGDVKVGQIPVVVSRSYEIRHGSPTPSPATTYVVVGGDTLYGISRKTGVTVANLQAWNGLTSTVITVGQILRLQPATPTPSPTPPPAPTLSAPVRMSYSLTGKYHYGNVNGDKYSIGGYSASERPFVKNIQQWLIYKGCTSVSPGLCLSSGWADGRWEGETDAAMTAWHQRFYPGQPEMAQCWSDDYNRLARA